MRVLVPAGLIILNQSCFPALSIKKIKAKKLTILMPVHMVVQEGVALIFEISHKGLVAKPKANKQAAIASSTTDNCLGLFMSLV